MVKRFLYRLIHLTRRHLYLYLSLLIIFSVAISSFFILKFESGYPDSQIKTVADAIWWSAVGISTIGIGNVVPVSVSGKYLTLFLTVVGVVVISVITAKIASIFTEEEVRDDLNKIEKEIEGEIAVEDKQVEDKLDRLEKDLAEIKKKG